MALKSRIRSWLAVVSDTALAKLHDDVARLAGEVVRLNENGERLAGEIAALRSCGEEQEARWQCAVEALRNDLSAFANRFEAYTDRHYATADDLAELQRRIDGKDAEVEDVRIALVGLTEQWRWESEDLRKGLAAIAERIESQRKHA